ncbi:hypothetical protein RRG08_064361, partial [Elysia crispata]
MASIPSQLKDSTGMSILPEHFLRSMNANLAQMLHSETTRIGSVCD